MFYVSSNLLRLFIIGNFRVTLSHQTWQKDISDFNSGSVHHIVMYTENQLKSILVPCDCEPLMWTGAICASLPAEDLFSCDRARNVHQFMFMPRALRSWCTVCLESINKQVLVFSIQGCTQGLHKKKKLRHVVCFITLVFVFIISCVLQGRSPRCSENYQECGEIQGSSSLGDQCTGEDQWKGSG